VIFLGILLILICILIYFYFRNFYKLKRNKKVKKIKNLNKNNLNSWMNLTKKERYDLSEKDSISSFNKRRILLEEIRNEYKRISKNNPKQN